MSKTDSAPPHFCSQNSIDTQGCTSYTLAVEEQCLINLLVQEMVRGDRELVCGLTPMPELSTIARVMNFRSLTLPIFHLCIGFVQFFPFAERKAGNRAVLIDTFMTFPPPIKYAFVCARESPCGRRESGPPAPCCRRPPREHAQPL